MNKILYLPSKFEQSRKKDQHGKDRLASVMIRSVHSAERASALSVKHDRQVLRVNQSSGSQTHCVLNPLQSIGPSLRRKVMTNLDSILKSRDIILPKKVHRVWM